MESFLQQCGQLHTVMLNELQTIEQQAPTILRQAADSVVVAEKYIQQLRTLSADHQFTTTAEEIQFFKTIKPGFTGWIFYYRDVFALHTRWPAGGEQVQQHYLQNCLQQVEQFFHANDFFYAYYRGGCSYLDEQYFVRGNYDWQLCPNSLYFDADTGFSTLYDQTVARLLAYDLLQEYIQKLQAKDKVPGDTITIIGGQKQKVNWTASKTDLVELVYALHAATVFNNGSASLRNIITCFQQAFNIELGDHYRLWLHIRARKTVRVKFLEALLKLLEKRLTGDDPGAEN